MGVVETIVDGKLYGLVHPYALDGRSGSHPVDARGFSTMNCYLMLEDDRALLWSTGYSFHQEALLEQLDGLVGDRALSLVIPRVEYASMCNARPVADRFQIAEVYHQLPDAASTLLNFRPEFPMGDKDSLRGVKSVETRSNTVAYLGANGGRPLEFHRAQLRLLPNLWAYDRETRTMFTGDMFAWITQDGPEGPWVLDNEADDSTTQDDVAHFLFRNRYWWLPGANTDAIRRWLKWMFETYDIEVIAPDHGPLLKGSAITSSVQYLNQILEAAASMPEIGIEASTWSMKGATA